MYDDANVISLGKQPEVVVVSMAGRMVRHARLGAGLTQRQLAARAGIPQETIARIERGRADPRVHTLDRLLAAAGSGLEVMPRLGIGVDRSQINALLDLEPAARLRQALATDAANAAFIRRLRRVAG